jgi:hypothetical protein
MVHRSGWGTGQEQEVTLEICILRTAFDAILAQANNSTYILEMY